MCGLNKAMKYVIEQALTMKVLMHSNKPQYLYVYMGSPGFTPSFWKACSYVYTHVL